MILRNANKTDAAEIIDIYKPYILSSPVTFETGVPALAEFENRIEHYKELFPWLVAETDGQIAGYAYASKYREREAYQWDVESSVYIHPDFKGEGVGAVLYNALFDFLKYQGIRKVYAVITLPNDPSVKFHERFGFRWFATYKNTGYKSGAWHDVGWWEIDINDFEPDPRPPIPFSKIPESVKNQVLLKFNTLI